MELLNIIGMSSLMMMLVAFGIVCLSGAAVVVAYTVRHIHRMYHGRRY